MGKEIRGGGGMKLDWNGIYTPLFLDVKNEISDSKFWKPKFIFQIQFPVFKDKNTFRVSRIFIRWNIFYGVHKEQWMIYYFQWGTRSNSK